MTKISKAFLSTLALLLSGIGLFLSAWIFLPAPTMLLLTLAVGAPEVCPWLFVFNAIAFLLAWLWIYQPRLKSLACIVSFLGLLICGLELATIPHTQTQMGDAIALGLGTNYLEKVPVEIGAKMRSQPFNLTDSFVGIHRNRTRHQTGIRFANSNGVPLSMEVYQPLQVGKYPALVVIYGGAWQRGSPSANPEFNQYMASRGYTVFAIDYRHAPQYRFPAQLEDVRAALNFIRTHAIEYEADVERMVLLGRSSGAHLAMLAAYQPDAPPLRAVINYYGPVNLAEGYKDPPSPDPINVRRVLEAFLGGTPQELPKQYEIASPVHYVTRPLPPTLLVYGDRDHIVQAKFGRRMYQRLLKSNTTAVYLEIPRAEHAFDAVFNGVSNQLALYYTERFLAWAFFSQ
ncbi:MULTISPECIES: alpha/beta hydrolase [Nostocales]|uniref:Alpha/beta hydrolase n=3 Tax=Nostocales TaxID=1161 RepID=A0A0C1N1R7_9CYAN|nr:alpha/beta hydrolase [Tolypothrix bouteillei]KAF3883771.1 alpha/beta hydrolase [Tolypothrix bouteillei VB521301]